MSFRLRPKAEADITDIALYIAEDDPAAARRRIAELYDRFQKLGGESRHRGCATGNPS